MCESKAKGKANKLYVSIVQQVAKARVAQQKKASEAEAAKTKLAEELHKRSPKDRFNEAVDSRIRAMKGKGKGSQQTKNYDSTDLYVDNPKDKNEALALLESQKNGPSPAKSGGKSTTKDKNGKGKSNGKGKGKGGKPTPQPKAKAASKPEGKGKGRGAKSGGKKGGKSKSKPGKQ
eukprot:TRINITY_DN30240_c0_g1_i1.p1 TRINITY_DN30240_c0_g1~~TRINITY_DN30240_c0_g1_i1.p1  ORF type:complete len:176 (+),score=59.73 TRINITY_DN30240_c0_g1_i1:124-651(+)